MRCGSQFFLNTFENKLNAYEHFGVRFLRFPLTEEGAQLAQVLLGIK